LSAFGCIKWAPLFHKPLGVAKKSRDKPTPIGYIPQFMIYADYNATSPLGEAASRYLREAMEIWGNPSSAHRLGRQALQRLRDWRETVATAAGAAASEVVFTSGGSEANLLALMGSRYGVGEGFRLLTSRLEHSSVKDTVGFLQALGTAVEFVKVRPDGQLDIEDLAAKILHFRPHLVSVMTANNETGVINPIEGIARLCHEQGVLLHTDAVQALGKLEPTFWKAADFVSISAHKIHGPKGTGALLVRKGKKLQSIHFGGSQETKRRGGTENFLGIAGFAGACSVLPSSEAWQPIENLRNRFEARLRNEAGPVHILGDSAARLPNTTNVRFPGIPAEVLITTLDLDGVCISAGSACSSGSIDPSHVLLGIGLSNAEAKEGIRISWGLETTAGEVDTVADLVVNHVQRIRARRQSSVSNQMEAR